MESQSQYQIGSNQKSDTHPEGVDFDKWEYIFKWTYDKEGHTETIGCHSLNAFYQFIYNDNPKHFFQVIRENKPIREYYDIDIEEKFREEEWETQNIKFLKDFFYNRNELLSELNLSGILQPEDFMILTSHSTHKLSFHLYSTKTYFENIEAHKHFSKMLKAKISVVDTSVYYKNRLLRLIGNSKFGQNRPLVGYKRNYKIEETLIELHGNTDGLKKIEIPYEEKQMTFEKQSIGDISSLKIIKNFLKANPWFQLYGDKLRRINDGIRRPCLVCPTETHGTENMSINKYGDLYYIQCFQHSGKYLIEGQEVPTQYGTNWWDGEIFNHSICAEYVKSQLENQLFFTETHKWIIYNPDKGTWSANKDQVNILERVCHLLKSSIPDKIDDKNLQKIAIHRKNQVGMTGFLQGIIKMLESILLDNSIMEKLDSFPQLFAFNDGWLFDLKKAEYRKIQKQDYILTTCGLEHTAEPVSCDKIDALLLDIFGEPELVKSYLSSVACYLYGENINEKFIIYTGIGRNGKGVMDSIIQKMLGDYYTTMSVNQLTDMNQSADRANSELASTQYARCVMTHEPESCSQATTLKVGIIKKLTGRDSITTRFLYGQKFSFKPKFTPTIQANEMPNLSKRDDAISKRLVKINFPFQFVENPVNDYQKQLDIGLKERVVEDLDYSYGLLQRVLELWLETKGKIYISDGVKQETEDYLREQNPLREWFETNFEIIDWDTQNNIPANQMYEYYKSDTMSSTLTSTKFGSLLKELCPVKKSNGTRFTCQRRKLRSGYNPLD